MIDVKRGKKAEYVLKRTLSTIVFVLGLAVLATFVIFAVFGDKIAPYSVTQSFDKFLPCSNEHLLGTNNIGYDIWSQIIVATRYTLTVGVSSALACLVIGVTIGIVAGYAGGMVSEAVNGFINFFLLIPMLPAAIVIASYANGGQLSIILTISLLCWCSTARAVRAKTMSIRESDYIKSLKSIGYGGGRILFGHVLPNVADIVAARFIPSVASCIMVEATLSFLGLGSIENITWGVMINKAYTYGGITLEKYNWVLAPGVCIILLQLSFYMINQFVEFRKKIVQESTIKYR